MIFRRLRAMLISATVFAVLVLGMVYFFQRKLIYFPQILSPESALRQAALRNLEPVRGPGGESLGWQTPRNAATRHRLLVFHGNGSLAVFDTRFTRAAPPGWQVVLAEYPGYGTRPGLPTETSIRESASAILQLLERDGLPVFLAGESLGSGVASWAAGTFPDKISGVILVTPFTRLAAVAALHYPWLPVRLLLQDRFEAEAALHGYRGPVAFVVGGQDEIIPPVIGRELHGSYAGPKLLWEQPGAGHNSIDFSPAAWARIFAFLLHHDAR